MSNALLTTKDVADVLQISQDAVTILDRRLLFHRSAVSQRGKMSIRESVTMLTRVTIGGSMKQARSIVLSMRLPVESGRRLKRIANRHGWTPSDASARLVEEGLRRSEFAFLDFRDSPVGRQAYIQGSTLAIWEVLLLLRSYNGDVMAVAKHLEWPESKVRAAVNYSEAFPEEVKEVIAENDSTTFEDLKRMLPQAVDFTTRKTKRG